MRKFLSLLTAVILSIPMLTQNDMTPYEMGRKDDALGIGLVDEIGTLEDAIKYAADLAGDENLASWNIKGYPAPQTTMEMIMSSINGPKEDYAVRLAKQFCKTGVYARLPIEMKLAY